MTFDDFLDQAVLERFRGADRIAADDHLDREFGTDRARQALRAAAPGSSEFHLGQAQFGVLGRNRKWQASATSRRRPVPCMNGGNDRFRTALHHREHLMQTRVLAACRIR